MQCKHPHLKWVRARAPSNTQCQYILPWLQSIESTWAERARLCFWKWSQNESMASVHSATQNVKGTKVGFMSKSVLTFLLCCTLKITGDNKSIVSCHICKRRVFQSQEPSSFLYYTIIAGQLLGHKRRYWCIFQNHQLKWVRQNQQWLHFCLQCFIINNALPVLMQWLQPPFTNTPRHHVTTFSFNVRLSGGESALLLYHTLTWAY